MANLQFWASTMLEVSLCYQVSLRGESYLVAYIYYPPVPPSPIPFCLSFLPPETRYFGVLEGVDLLKEDPIRPGSTPHPPPIRHCLGGQREAPSCLPPRPCQYLFRKQKQCQKRDSIEFRGDLPQVEDRHIVFSFASWSFPCPPGWIWSGNVHTIARDPSSSQDNCFRGLCPCQSAPGPKGG